MEQDPLKPSPHLLCKLGSIIVHAEEGMSNNGHAFDIITLESLLNDEGVKEWLTEMHKLALIPRKR